MPLKLFDTKEAVPEALRATAVEGKDGKWIVAEDPAPLGDAGKKALEEERTARQAAEARAKAAETERDTLKRTADARAKGISEEELQRIRDDEAKARKPLEDRAAALEAENRKLKLTDRVRALALKSGVMPDRIDKAMKDLEGRVDLTQDGNSIVVKTSKGEATAETIEDFLGKTYKTETPFFYAGTGGNGGDSPGSDGAPPAPGGYDPVKAGKEAAAVQKKGARENERAFR